MSFKSAECGFQLAWKRRTTALSQEAKVAGHYTGPTDGSKASEFHLHESRCEENLLPWIRSEALAHFRGRGIAWHHGNGEALPSNYLMDSMVSCVNCLFPFMHAPKSLAALLRPVVPGAVGALQLDGGGHLVFEWLGQDNYLDERSEKRKPGAFGTSIDAHCILVAADGVRVGVNIEWKYTEANEAKHKFGKHYLPQFEEPNGPINPEGVGGGRSLQVEPLYQLARQHLLAAAMERVREHDVDRVVHLVIVPDTNTDFRRLGMPLPGIPEGVDALELFRSLLRAPDRFAVASFQGLVKALPEHLWPAPRELWSEVVDRYVAGR